uniref:DUF4274 domain-containing protein n=1 Tax=Enterocloster clostridioformis TaxID=1531 RepID=UPI0026F1DEEA|nr:DUF4274 domain-containing protein [Enterocloster clostridioformis]
MSINYFESKESKERATYILESYNCSNLLNEQSDAYILDEFIDNYNWDDGFEAPYFILNHKNCELGTALKIFYFSAGTDMLEAGYKNYKLGHWVEFIEYAYKKIAEGNYKSQFIAFKFPLMEDEKVDIKEAGWPNVFIEDIAV